MSSITPLYAAHEMDVEAGRMGSPSEPCVEVHLVEDGEPFVTDRFTPAQARELARLLVAAADEAEGL